MIMIMDKAESSGSGGFTLVELIITVLVLGLIGWSFSALYSGLLSAATEDESGTGALLLAESVMEKSIGAGVDVATTGWISSSSYQWKRGVTVLRSGAGGPTLVEVRVRVRDDSGMICSLVTHIAE